jgi:hypothetical protein
VSYTFFTSQVDARNVKEITSTADTIEGQGRLKVGVDRGPAPADSLDTSPAVTVGVVVARIGESLCG